MGTSSASPSSPVPRPCITVDRPCTQAPGGLWDTPRLRRLGRGPLFEQDHPHRCPWDAAASRTAPMIAHQSPRRHTRTYNADPGIRRFPDSLLRREDEEDDAVVNHLNAPCDSWYLLRRPSCCSVRG